MNGMMHMMYYHPLEEEIIPPSGGTESSPYTESTIPVTGSGGTAVTLSSSTTSTEIPNSSGTEVTPFSSTTSTPETDSTGPVTGSGATEITLTTSTGIGVTWGDETSVQPTHTVSE